MAGTSRIWRVASVTALAIAAPLLLMSPAGAAPAGPAGGQAPQPARFTAPGGKIDAGQVALFTARPSGGSPVGGYSWTVSGPGVVGKTFSAMCTAHTSEMESSFGRAGVMHVTVRISYTDGTVSTAAHTVVVKPAKVRPIASTMTRQATQWMLCLRGPADPLVQPVGSGGPPPGCQDEYFAGPIDAVGCFTALPSYGKIPAPERALLCRVIRCPGATVVPELLPVLSKHAIRLNGIDIAPATALVLDPNDGWIVSPNATASMLNGLLPLRTGRLRVAVYSRPLFSANLDQLIAKYPALATVLNLSGLQVSGRLTVTLARYQSIVQAALKLPASFTGSGGNPVTSSAMFTAGNQAGLVLDDMLIRLPSMNFGDTLKLDHLALCYQQHIIEEFCENKTGVSFGSYEHTLASSFNALGDINILGTEITAVPTRTDPQQGIGFVNGQFNFAGAAVTFNPALPLGGTGVSLSSLQGSVALNPTRIQGAIGLTAGDLVSISGQLFLVFASPSQPYTFTGHEVGATGMPTPTVTSTAVAVGGSVGVLLPVVGVTQLGSGYVLFYPGYLAAGGSIGISLLSGALTVKGGVNGQFSLDNQSFDVQGYVNVTALGWLNMSATAVVSSVGIAACGTFLGATAGVGYKWGAPLPTVSIGSCDLSPYQVIVTIGPGSTRSAAAPIRLRVPPGLPTEMVQVRGHGGAPEVTITGPGGLHGSITSGGRMIAKTLMIFRNTSTDTTYIAILKPTAGTYTITASPGSPRVTQVLAAQGRTGPSLLHQFTVHLPGQRQLHG